MFSDGFHRSPRKMCRLSKHNKCPQVGKRGLFRCVFTQNTDDYRQHRGKTSSVCRSCRWILPAGLGTERKIQITDTLSAVPAFMVQSPSLQFSLGWSLLIKSLHSCHAIELLLKYVLKDFFHSYFFFPWKHGQSLNLMFCRVKPQGFTQSSSIIVVDTKKSLESPGTHRARPDPPSFLHTQILWITNINI